LDNEQSQLQSSYDRVAEEYAKHYSRELEKKPFDRKMLELLVERVANGEICDIGCGPGHVADYLHSLGARSCGIDLSNDMVQQARRLHPDLLFKQGNMLDLSEVGDNSFGGIAAFYSLIHIPRDLVSNALRELKRVLVPGGTILIAFHIGNETIHRDEWWGKEVNVDFAFFEVEEMKNYIQKAELQLNEVMQREPYTEEYPSQRAYIFAEKA
jgi:ubiquinone/menaquinone biosynthesis C-methylase UbiE